jgi:hypothetical protein
MSGTRTGVTVTAIALAWAALAGPATPAAASAAEDALRVSWVGRWVVLETAALSNCDERYTNNRMRGPLPDSHGRHRFEPGELGRVDNLHLQRSRIDLLVGLDEPLRVELRDGPFQLFEQLGCRVEVELPVPRAAVRRGAVKQLDALIRNILEPHEDRTAAAASPSWNRRQVEPLPADHDERLAAYEAWKQEQLYRALRDRLHEALDRAADIAHRTDDGVAYARGLASGAREADRNRFTSTDCVELPSVHFSERRDKAPEDLDESDKRDWRDGFEDGQRLLFEITLARRLERCLD